MDIKSKLNRLFSELVKDQIQALMDFQVQMTDWIDEGEDVRATIESAFEFQEQQQQSMLNRVQLMLEQLNIDCSDWQLEVNTQRLKKLEQIPPYERNTERRHASVRRLFAIIGRPTESNDPS